MKKKNLQLKSQFVRLSWSVHKTKILSLSDVYHCFPSPLCRNHKLKTVKPFSSVIVCI